MPLSLAPCAVGMIEAISGASARVTAVPEAVVATVKSTAADASARLNSTLTDVRGALSKVKVPKVTALKAPKLNLTAPKLPDLKGNFSVKGAWQDALETVQKRTGFNITDLKFVSGGGQRAGVVVVGGV